MPDAGHERDLSRKPISCSFVCHNVPYDSQSAAMLQPVKPFDLMGAR